MAKPTGVGVWGWPWVAEPVGHAAYNNTCNAEPFVQALFVSFLLNEVNVAISACLEIWYTPSNFTLNVPTCS